MLSVNYYKEAIDLLKRLQKRFCPQDFRLTHTIQTNGTLITQKWCDFFKAYSVSLGLSCDGPQEIHDRYRVDWRRVGSFGRLQRGIALLKQNGIELHLLTTVHPATLDNPGRFIDFIFGNEFKTVMLNPVGQMAHNTKNYLQATPQLDQRYRDFLVQILERQRITNKKLRIKAFDLIINSIFFGSLVNPSYQSDNHPFWLLTVDSDGNFSTFSPQLLTAKSGDDGDFILGNLCRDSLESVARSGKFLDLWADIQAGLSLCQSECGYFSVCGGGQPCVKYSEKGTFKATETDDCRYRIKIPTDVIMDELESAVHEATPLRRWEPQPATRVS